ncbi:MAG: response regulator [Anaerolineae bacterium]|nr:response regulator [Anaerolineae bacterium]
MSAFKPKILIVDDKPENLYTLNRLLQQLDVEVIEATSGFEGLRLTLENELCLAIVDVQMPEMDGYELVELLRGNQSTKTLPVIFVSAIYSDEYHHRKAYDAGAVDFLQKPLQPDILISKVQVFLDLYRQKLQLQTLVNELNTANTTLSQRAVQLETSAQVSHQITSLLDLNSLLPQVVDLIQTRFGYYFTGVWLIDEYHAILYAGSHLAGEQAFNSNIRIATDSEQYIVARVCQSRQVQIADQVCATDVFAESLHIPEGCCELGLPLIFGHKMLGVLHIQRQDLMFSTEDITVLQTLADQIAIAIRNAQLYSGLEDEVKARTSQLERAYEQLEMLDRNKSEFIQVVSHELRTPLTLIKGFSQLLMTEVQSNSAIQQEVAGIVSGAERMQDIVNSMLDMVKIDSQTLSLNPQTLSLAAVVSTLHVNLAETLLSRHLQMNLENLGTLPKVEADLAGMNKLFTHLLSNAIKYTPDGGEITVSGHMVENLNEVPDEKFVEITISDTGIGIDPAVQELIFSKLYRATDTSFHSSGKTKFKGGGPGLGLAISRGIVEAHGGHIWVESEGYDEQRCPGSHFHIIMPVRQGIKTPAGVQQHMRDLQITDAPSI